MLSQLIIMILLPLIGCLFALTSAKKTINAFNVTVFTLVSNILVMLKLFSLIDISSPSLQLRQSYEWISEFNLRTTYGVDAFSLILLLGIYISGDVRTFVDHQDRFSCIRRFPGKDCTVQSRAYDQIIIMHGNVSFIFV